jgi:acetyl esterase
MKTVFFWWFLMALARLAPAVQGETIPSPRPKPSRADVAYGEDPLQRLDLWIPPATGDGLPSPVVIHFHGGGFVKGDKSGFDPTIPLEAGFGCVSANYRFVNGTDRLVEAPFADAARVVQFVRERAEEFGVDGGRIALIGETAGGVLALWVAYHDDFRDPKSDDEIARRSTKVHAVVTLDAPTNLLPEWILANVGGRPEVHPAFALMFGQKMEEVIAPETQRLIRSVSPWHHVSADDPPTFLAYTGAPVEEVLPPETDPLVVVHHANFGEALSERLREKGVECSFVPEANPEAVPEVLDFLRHQFGMVD